MSMFYNDDNELVTSYEIDNLLAELPFDLIRESIIEQIDDPISTRVNYVDVITDKVAIYRAQFEGNTEALTEINTAVNDFFEFILTNLNEKFHLGLDIESITSGENVEEVGTSLYKYFILRYTKNITKFISKYISKNKKFLCEKYADKPKKDVSTLAYKKHIKNKEDLTILTNLPSIIDEIIHSDISNEEFLKYSASTDSYEVYIISGLIDNNKMIGDFYSSYMGLCINEHDHVIDELQTEIRQKIIKKMSD